MLEKIRKHTNIKSQIAFAMESTAHYWLALFTRLRKDGYHVILLNPIQTSAMRDMFIRKIKTDAKDSFIIAELIRFGRYAESNVAQDRLLALKELCRNRFYLVDMAGDLKRKLIALIDRVFPEYEAQFDTIFCKSSVAVLKKYPTPQKLSNAHLDKLTELLWNSSNGHFGEWKARELKELARNSFGVEDCDGAYSTLILLMLDQIQSLSGKADALEKKYPDCFRALIRRSRRFPALDRSLEPSFSAKSEISPAFLLRTNSQPILASIRLSTSPASSRLRTRICPNGALRICADASGWRLRSLYSAIPCSARITRRKPQKGSNT